MKKDISIIIVNYNVRHFLKRCLESVYNSKTEELSIEVFVVDNASIDGSNEMVRSDFKNVHLIANEENVGFSVANNQAIRVAQGKHVLILNPDTVLQEDTLRICFAYMETHQEVGALGVKMIDGSGHFLPESKRALPTVWNSFAKLTGLAALFPSSKIFNGYALGHLSEDENHSIEVLCGAFMFVRKSAIDRVGMFDERFFMYGEDIDWSRRIIEGGFKIHYVSNTAIIHYKGESTKKSSLSYVKTFYNAMALYVEKHYTGRKGKWFAKLLHLGISLRAMISGLKRLVIQLIHPILDGILIGIALKGFSYLWAEFYFKNPNYYEGSSINWNIGGYALIWAFVFWFIGYYKKPSIRKRLMGVLSGVVCILILYALLPDEFRSSRLIILAGTMISLIITSVTSLLINRTSNTEKSKNILIVADVGIAATIQEAIQKAGVKSNILGIVNPVEGAEKELDYLNDLSELGPLAKVLKADEIIFSSESLPMKEIMKQMMILDTKLSFKIAGDDSLSILGSNSKNTSGELYNVNIQYNLADGYYQHVKRIFDFSMSVLLLIISPILLFLNSFKLVMLYKNIFATMLGIQTWVGYNGGIKSYQNLPELSQGVIPIPVGEKDDNQVENMYYARDYSVWKDLEVLFKNLNRLTS
ncbi:MAG: glycosyltransferase [Saprospiraceae bacterium]|nr:glycosyltransferase [Saprospiraceae bacterium]